MVNVTDYLPFILQLSNTNILQIRIRLLIDDSENDCMFMRIPYIWMALAVTKELKLLLAYLRIEIFPIMQLFLYNLTSVTLSVRCWYGPYLILPSGASSLTLTLS
jgi:hypothetical protein